MSDLSGRIRCPVCDKPVKGFWREVDQLYQLCTGCHCLLSGALIAGWPRRNVPEGFLAVDIGVRIK